MRSTKAICASVYLHTVVYYDTWCCTVLRCFQYRTHTIGNKKARLRFTGTMYLVVVHWANILNSLWNATILQ